MASEGTLFARFSSETDNPANKPKKIRQGMAAKPERATKAGIDSTLDDDDEDAEEFDLGGPVHPLRLLSQIKELRRMRTYYTKRMKAGKAMETIRAFSPEFIDQVVAGELHQRAQKSLDQDELDLVFDDAVHLLGQ